MTRRAPRALANQLGKHQRGIDRTTAAALADPAQALLLSPLSQVLFDDPNASIPKGYQLKAWLFGGASISTSVALFDLATYACPGSFGAERIVFDGKDGSLNYAVDDDDHIVLHEAPSTSWARCAQSAPISNRQRSSCRR